jgi:hypothetical protein
MFAGLVAAPAIIAIDRLMPVKLWKPRVTRLLWWEVEYVWDGKFYNPQPIDITPVKIRSVFL